MGVVFRVLVNTHAKGRNLRVCPDVPTRTPLRVSPTAIRCCVIAQLELVSAEPEHTCTLRELFGSLVAVNLTLI